MSKIGEARTEEELRAALMGAVSRAFLVMDREDPMLLGRYMDWLIDDDFLTLEEAMTLLDTVKDVE